MPEDAFAFEKQPIHRSSGLDYEFENGVLNVRLNRPEKMNALTLDMVARIRDLLVGADVSEEVGCLLLSSSGRAFCAGRDLADAAPGEDAEAILRDVVNPLIAAMFDLSKPTIAAVNGAAMGIGLGLALAADIVLATPTAAFSSPFSRLGGALDSGGHYFLSRTVGDRRALAMIYTGQPVMGDDALAWGLVNQLIESELLFETAKQMAVAIAAGPRLALKTQKQLLRQAGTEPLGAILDLEAQAQGVLAGTADYAEGIAAFKERRTPRFSS